ncbi:hypothetical protein JCM17960_13760 [Magnetospira thiophila]
MAEKITAKGVVVALLIGLVFLLALSEVFLRVLMPHWNEFYSGRFMTRTLVPNHGIVPIGVPGFDGYFAQSNGDFRARIVVNEFGLRNDEPVSAANDRVWVVGDSMTFGWGIERDQIFTAIIAAESGRPTYNVASPGTGICGYQALLARMPQEVKPKAVVLGLVLENDILIDDCAAEARLAEHNSQDPTHEAESDPISLPLIKGILIHNSALYNFLTVAVKRVNYLREFLTDIGLIERGHVYHRAIDETSLERSVAESIKGLVGVRDLVPEGTPFAILIVPARFEIRDGDPFYAKMRAELTAGLMAEGFPIIDPFEAFVAAGFEPTHFAHDGHWSALGHQIAGTAAAQWVKTLPQ